ncbi:MerR family transcriptional regulator [Auritidibacter ignavus]|uniref:transcriptional regulator FtsR n=1 Tax=Auritidibacter ignavus TaxID=678932 RepID=UPI0024BB1B41|nr:MerR family transcriptional regulator [Auritidibacter ignavus]WHS27707.1 MerR family transcriptional regulator [Auritidibacter ignavus]WHS34629.1 MerR family transcriptional regulator [Auritidibacter ignavus]
MNPVSALNSYPSGSSRGVAGLLTIGEVLAEINDEFPEVRASKIRFLEEKGLITPRRTPAGYRKYSHTDIERLRFILSVQRDQYLPLRVIKDYLDAVDAGQHPDSLPGGLRFEPRSVSEQLAQEIAGHARPLTRSELIGTTGADEQLIAGLEANKLIWPTGSGRYTEHALKVVRAAMVLSTHGFEARHLRPFRMMADRELGLIEQATAGLKNSAQTTAASQREEIARDISQACLELHAAVIGAEIAEATDE